MDIVIVGLQPWYYEIGSNCRNIALQLARHHRVLYVNLPVNRKTYLSKDQSPGIQEHVAVIKGKGETLRPISGPALAARSAETGIPTPSGTSSGNPFPAPGMWELYPPTIVESINAIPITPIFSAINYFNNKRFARDIRKACDTLGFKNIILFNDNDIYNGYFLKELLKPALYIYYMRDFLQGFGYWKRHTTVLEPKLIAKADVAVANSLFYTDYCKERNPQSFYIGQGCNFDLFNTETQQPKPAELEGLKGPIIGYVGAIDSTRLDPQIIKIIATQHPDWTIVMVGPEDAPFQASDLHQLPNIHWTGRKPMTSLPAFVAHFDVCINPQLVNIATKGNYPLKIDEYLAMGKPVVATRTPTMKLFEDHTWLADKPEEYPALIEKALTPPSPETIEAHIRFARNHTWENCVNELYTIIGKFIHE